MANDYSSDSTCKSLWRFEDGALTTDSKGGNTLTAVGSPVADVVDFREGAACADIEYSTTDYFTIVDAALDAGFPLKSGDTTKKIALCAWIKQESQTATSGYVFGKYDLANNKRSLGIVTISNVLNIYWGHTNGTAVEIHNTGIPIANGAWYHVTIIVDGVAKTIKVLVYTASTGLFQVFTITAVNELSVTDAPFRIGARGGDTSYRWDGRIDELVAFDRLITDAEVLAIVEETFPNTNEKLAAISVHILDFGPGIGGISVHILELNRAIGSIGVHILEPTYSAVGHRTFPLPNTKTVWQSQSGKRKFPMPGVQVVE